METLPSFMTEADLRMIRGRAENYPVSCLTKEIIDLSRKAAKEMQTWCSARNYVPGPQALVELMDALLDTGPRDHPNRKDWEAIRTRWLEYLDRDIEGARLEKIRGSYMGFVQKDYSDAISVPSKGKLCTAGSPTPGVDPNVQKTGAS